MATLLNIFPRVALACTLFGALTLPAAAAGNYVHDAPGLLSSATVTSLNTTIDALHTQTGKEVVVDIVDSLNGQTPQAVAERDFASLQVNGVMIFVSKQPKSIGVIPDRVSRAIFPTGMTSTIRSSIRSGFKSGDYNGGVTNGVNLIVDTYRSHAGALRDRTNMRRVTMPTARQSVADEGSSSHINWFWIIIIGIAIFLIVRAIARAASGPRYYPPGGGGYGPGPGFGQGPGPGYGGGGGGFGGGGFGGGGGGGGFFSSMLGGLGGAFLGNELFNSFNRPQGQQNMQQPQTYDSSAAGFGGDGGNGGGYDQGAFQNDAGQADMGNSSFGDWGGSGGDSGGGFGDSGGGGGDNSGW